MEEKSLVVSDKELEIRQVESAAVIASSLKTISEFLTGGGLQTLLNGYAKSQAVKEILGGLAQHSGRQGVGSWELGVKNEMQRCRGCSFF